MAIGFATGIYKLPLNLTLLKSCDVRGAFAGRDPDRNRKNVAQLLDWWEDGNIRPRIARTWHGSSLTRRITADLALIIRYRSKSACRGTL